MRLSADTNTFGDVIKMAAAFFGLPISMVFLSDKQVGGVIYMHEQFV